MYAGHAESWPKDDSGPAPRSSGESEAITHVYLTIDTEYEPGFTAKNGPDTREANFRRSILGEIPEGAVGIGYQIDQLDRHGLKAVFFVDPMPALLWGVEAISDIVGPIIERGHDVQLHLHTEWLALAGAANPLAGRTGDNLRDFPFEDQCVLIDHARSTLMAAGAPPPVAFRAGNFGANDDTLRALYELGIAYDTSCSPGFEDAACDCSLRSSVLHPTRHLGVIEVPVGCINDLAGRKRHAQLTALSKRELLAAIRHARDHRIGCFTIVSHSFELLNRDRRKVNKLLKRRFEGFCKGLAGMRGVRTATYSDEPPCVDHGEATQVPLPGNAIREGWRIAEQSVANLLYDNEKAAVLAGGVVAATIAAATTFD